MNYPVLFSLCLVFFAAHGILVNDQNEENGVAADNQNEISCGVQGEDQNEGREDKNVHERCSVCYVNNPNTSIGECEHKFCINCIDNWKFNKRTYRCPLCNHVYDNFDFIANELSTYLRINNLREVQRYIYTFAENLVNMLFEAIRNTNTTTVFTANDLSEAIRNINTPSGFTDGIYRDLINDMAEAIRNINTTSDLSDNDLMQAIRNVNATSDNIDGFYRVFIIMLFEAIRKNNRTSVFTVNDIRVAIRNINITRNNIVNMVYRSIREINMTLDNTDDNSVVTNENTTPLDTNDNTTPQDTSVFGFPRVNDSSNLSANDTNANITPQETRNDWLTNLRNFYSEFYNRVFHPQISTSNLSADDTNNITTSDHTDENTTPLDTNDNTTSQDTSDD